MEISFNKMTSMNFLSCTKSQGLFSSLPKSVQRALPWESKPFTWGLRAPWVRSASPASQGSPKGTAVLPPSSSSLSPSLSPTPSFPPSLFEGIYYDSLPFSSLSNGASHPSTLAASSLRHQDQPPPLSPGVSHSFIAERLHLRTEPTAQVSSPSCQLFKGFCEHFINKGDVTGCRYFLPLCYLLAFDFFDPTEAFCIFFLFLYDL